MHRSLAGFTLVFGHEQLELIQLDGVEVESQQQQGVNSVGILFPGQRMDFVLRSPSDMDQRPSSLTVQLDEEYACDIQTLRDERLMLQQWFQLSQPSPNTEPNIPHNTNRQRWLHRKNCNNQETRGNAYAEPPRHQHDPLFKIHHLQHPPNSPTNIRRLHQNPETRHKPQHPQFLLQPHLMAPTARTTRPAHGSPETRMGQESVLVPNGTGAGLGRSRGQQS